MSHLTFCLLAGRNAICGPYSRATRPAFQNFIDVIVKNGGELAYVYIYKI